MKKIGTSPTGRWGLFDTVDNVWMGNDDGPLRYDEEDLAKVAAQMADNVAGFKPGRIRARLIDGANFRLKDEVKNKMTPLEALVGLEEGRLI